MPFRSKPGHCPSGRLFEAAACGTPIITDCWDGLEIFFQPGEEILVARQTDDVLAALELSDEQLARIAGRARHRVELPIPTLAGTVNSTFNEPYVSSIVGYGEGRRLVGALAVCLLAAGVAPADAQDTPQAFVNARIVNLSQREADIAITLERPEQGRLISAKLTDYTLGLYASRAYLETYAPTRDREDLRERPGAGRAVPARAARGQPAVPVGCGPTGAGSERDTGGGTGRGDSRRHCRRLRTELAPGLCASCRCRAARTG